MGTPPGTLKRSLGAGDPRPRLTSMSTEIARNFRRSGDTFDCCGWGQVAQIGFCPADLQHGKGGGGRDGPPTGGPWGRVTSIGSLGIFSAFVAYDIQSAIQQYKEGYPAAAPPPPPAVPPAHAGIGGRGQKCAMQVPPTSCCLVVVGPDGLRWCAFRLYISAHGHPRSNAHLGPCLCRLNWPMGWGLCVRRLGPPLDHLGHAINMYITQALSPSVIAPLGRKVPGRGSPDSRLREEACTLVYKDLFWLQPLCVIGVCRVDSIVGRPCGQGAPPPRWTEGRPGEGPATGHTRVQRIMPSCDETFQALHMFSAMPNPFFTTHTI